MLVQGCDVDRRAEPGQMHDGNPVKASWLLNISWYLSTSIARLVTRYWSLNERDTPSIMRRHREYSFCMSIRYTRLSSRRKYELGRTQRVDRKKAARLDILLWCQNCLLPLVGAMSSTYFEHTHPHSGNVRVGLRPAIVALQVNGVCRSTSMRTLTFGGDVQTCVAFALWLMWKTR